MNIYVACTKHDESRPTAHALSYSIDLWFGDFYPYCLQLSKKTFIFRCRCFTLAGIYKQQPRAMLPMQR